MSEPDATAPQTGGGKGAADEKSALRWQAADEFLTALVVSPTAHRNLVEVRRAFERAEALGVLSSFSETSDDEEGSEGEVGGAGFAEPRPDRPLQQESVSGGAGSAAGDAPVEASSGTPAEEPQAPEMSPEERAEVNDVVDAMATSALPLAAEVLERFDAERIRPELVGLSRPGLDSALAMLGGGPPGGFVARAAERGVLRALLGTVLSGGAADQDSPARARAGRDGAHRRRPAPHAQADRHPGHPGVESAPAADHDLHRPARAAQGELKAN